MKKRVLLTMVICLATLNTAVFAQPNDKSKKERFEKFKADRTEYISKAMNLTDDEKAAFWPLSNEFQMKKFELNKPLRDEIRKMHKAKKESQSVSEADYKKIIELSVQIKLQEAQLEQEYTSKFLKILSAEKVYLYQQAEQQFGRSMMGQFGPKDRREGDKPRKNNKV